MKLKQLERLKSIKPLDTIQTKQTAKLLSEIYLISYSSTILLQNTLIHRNEITVSEDIKNILLSEAIKISKALMSDNLQELEYTKKEINSFYKKVGIKRKI
ncbi:hypothetical protein [Aliarcobacter thereius]|uniref:Uncharacterized protein n=1 Tax=Aliarcobacter thereius LMG 24486 TaxID=1032240 RepID=A0A1C7WQ29_9BACT|nr:hypothetical protein [Aliarcobacter thereius]OCL95678.1 hypothetical protein AA347_01156 [Aliarcobacter thereius LMG 24486]QBF16337.1 hypothetical protein ATH_1291 [Aliarcobacter thereius LMG 24486]TLS91605.1 hypothetical protein FE244_08810 [Aliarcobacter thereius]